MKPTTEQLANAVRRFGILAYFPTDAMVQKEIMSLLERICKTQEALEWLTETMINQVGEWKGPVELRGVLCSRFKPADGIEAWSTIPGFTAADSEQESVEQIQSRESLGIPAGTSQKLIAGAKDPDTEIFSAVFPDIPVESVVKRIPPPTAADRKYSRKLLEHIVGPRESPEAHREV